MKFNKKEIIFAGCKVKEINQLRDMKRRKKHPLRIKAKEVELFFTAVYRLNLVLRGKNSRKWGA